MLARAVQARGQAAPDRQTQAEREAKTRLCLLHVSIGSHDFQNVRGPGSESSLFRESECGLAGEG